MTLFASEWMRRLQQHHVSMCFFGGDVMLGCESCAGYPALSSSAAALKPTGIMPVHCNVTELSDQEWNQSAFMRIGFIESISSKVAVKGSFKKNTQDQLTAHLSLPLFFKHVWLCFPFSKDVKLVPSSRLFVIALCWNQFASVSLDAQQQPLFWTSLRLSFLSVC